MTSFSQGRPPVRPRYDGTANGMPHNNPLGRPVDLDLREPWTPLRARAKAARDNPMSRAKMKRLARREKALLGKAYLAAISR